MDQSQIADITEIEQLLARYAIGMTRDDIDAVIDVFTPDGTYSAFGDTYALADFPALVAAAPKGLFLTGTPVLELDGDAGTGTQQTLCFVDQTTHDMRIGYYTDTYRRTAQGWRLQTRAMTFLRRSGARDVGQGARPDPARTLGGHDGVAAGAVELDEFKSAVDDWLDAHAERARLHVRGDRDTRRADGTTAQGDAADLRRGVHAHGLARARRRAGGIQPAARLPGRGAHGARPRRAGDLLHARGAGADHDRLRARGAGGGDGAAPAARGGDLVPGLLRAGTGSNLASLACRATRDGDAWRINGQKVWTSLAQYAQRCVLLTRTGTTESAHKGITALFVDMDSAGITVRPIETMHGAQEFCEVFFDDVVVPLDRVLGEVDHGWSIAMDLLPYERSTALWHRASYLQRRLEQLVAVAPAGSLDPVAVGEATELLWAFRARSRATQRRLAAGETLGAETSDRQGPGGDRRAGGLRPRGRRARRRRGRSVTTRSANAGGPSSSTPAPPPFTAAAPRSSATSSPGGCSTWGPTADGGDGARTLRERRAACHRDR